ncbi:MAG: HD domain-containing protein [Bacteroidota bacterium]
MPTDEKLSQGLDAILDFLKIAERLKSTIRSAHTATGRQESVAEHTWRLCLMGALLHPYYPELDLSRLLKILLIHDMGEIINGDIPAIYQDPNQDKTSEERMDFLQVLSPLPERQQEELLLLWDEYNEVKTPEAKVAKAIDKLETLLQHVQGDNPKDFDYGFNLDYGAKYTKVDPIITYLRQQLDGWTKERMSS